jgi:hypothetical protein
MKRLAAVLVVVLLAGTGVPAEQPSPDPQPLRTRLSDRFDIVPLTEGVGLRPKSPTRDIRLIEVNNDAILVNGAPVTGRELRDLLGDDAAAVLQLSYLNPDQRKAMLEPDDARERPEAEPPPPLERPSPPVSPEPPPGADGRRSSVGDRVRILGDVAVRGSESVGGQVVAVIGSVRVDGEVRDQVVAVLGSVDLGPKAIVRGDVVSIGGRVRRAEGAHIGGSVTEVAIAEPNVHLNFEPLFGWGGGFFNGFNAVPRLIGSTFRLMLLVLLASLALVVARPTVEASAQRVSDSPVQATLVGIAAQILLVPALVLTAIVFAISIIGIPLLLLLPVVVLLLLLLALAGFSGTVYAVGQWMRRRLGANAAPPIVDIFLGVVVILLPVLVGRLVAIAGWPGAPLAVLLVALGFIVEFVAWSSGFGAVLTNAAARWQARRAAARGAVA